MTLQTTVDEKIEGLKNYIDNVEKSINKKLELFSTKASVTHAHERIDDIILETTGEGIRSLKTKIKELENRLHQLEAHCVFRAHCSLREVKDNIATSDGGLTYRCMICGQHVSGDIIKKLENSNEEPVEPDPPEEDDQLYISSIALAKMRCIERARTLIYRHAFDYLNKNQMDVIINALNIGRDALKKGV